MRRINSSIPMPHALITGLLLALTLSACGPTGDTEKDAGVPFQCEAFYFDCGDDDQCIPSNDVCDGTEDCATGADEANCGGCNPGYMPCDDGTCVPGIFICDGVHGNCPDDSDEAHCD